MKNKPKWVDFPAMDCPNCGACDSEVYTNSTEDNLVYDQEEARCKECGHTGYINVEDSECADVIWDDLETNPQ